VLGTNGKQKIGHALRELIGRGLQDLPAGRRLGIVEISAGAPAFVMDACTALDFNRADYCFATTSASTLDEVAAN
jgi:phthiocerol/phenolphthiocerol synthesis type-I polyketide synthase C